MRILCLRTYSEPEYSAASYLSLSKDLACIDAGMEMLIYTPVPSRGVTREVRLEYKKNKRVEIKHNGKMKVVRFSLMKEYHNPLARALRYTLQCIIEFYLGAFKKEARNCDVIFISSTPPIQGAMAALVKKFNKKPIIYNLQDIFPDSLVGTGFTQKGGLLWKIGRMIENFTYRNADKIIVISEDFKRNIMAKGVPESKIEVIYNWVDENAIVPIPKEQNPLFEEFGIDRNKFTIVYAGNLGNAQNIQIIVDAAKTLKYKDKIQFIIFGSGGLEENVRKRIELEHLNNIKLFPIQPYERVSYVYGLGDACIVSCKAGLGGAAMPSKTWTIMACGRAVIANFDEGDLKKIIEENACGIFSKSDDLDGFVSAIEMLADAPEICVEMGKSSRRFILENLSQSVGTRKVVNVVKNLCCCTI